MKNFVEEQVRSVRLTAAMATIFAIAFTLVVWVDRFFHLELGLADKDLRDLVIICLGGLVIYIIVMWWIRIMMGLTKK